MKLDHNYNIETDKSNVYSDAFDEIVDLIIKAKAEGVLNDEDVAFILNLAIKKQNKKEIKSFFDVLFNNTQKLEKHNLFIHLKTNTIQYA